MQRRLSGMERDLAAINAKLDSLNEDSNKLAEDRPEEAEEIRREVDEIKVVWEDLKRVLRARDEALGEASELQNFLRDLDHFQGWLTKTQVAVASEDIPSNLAEAEKLLSDHKGIKEDITAHQEDHAKMLDLADKFVKGQEEDPQYLLLRERIKALDDGWRELHKMWDNRQNLLSQALELQMFLRDSKQAEVLLNHQDHYLSKEEPPKSLETAENAIKQQEAFITTQEANDEKLNAVIMFANRLCDEGHYAADKIHKKAANLEERRKNNHTKANEQLEKAKDSLQLHQYLQEVTELNEWVEEKAKDSLQLHQYLQEVT